MKKLFAMITALTVLGGAAVSCGKDSPEESAAESAVLEIPSVTVSGEETSEAVTEAETAAETTAAVTERSEDTTTDKQEEASETVTTTAAGSGENSAPEEEDQQEEQVQETPDEPQEEQSAEPDPEPQENDPEPDSIPDPEPVSGGIVFSYDTLLTNAGQLLDTLGAPNSRSVAEACTNAGFDVAVYQYPDIELQCYVDGGGEYIFDVKISGGDYSTPEGLRVGSSRSEVEGALGAGEVFGDTIIYQYGEKELDVIYSGDTVSSLEYYIPV